MRTNMEYIYVSAKSMIEVIYKENLPTLEQIYEQAESVRNAFAKQYPITDDEFTRVKKELSNGILHSIGYAATLKGRDSNHQSWYFVHENDSFYWNRYKEFLLKKWSRTVVNRLHATTNDVMDDLGDPTSENPFQRRGLLLGDVQSGKTATYTAICNKAADAGYKVIIILAGMMENLRMQTQERLDAEFVGLDSKYSLDKKADSSIRNKPVGVGKIPPFRPEKRISRFTSVTTDFNKVILNSMGLNLNDLNGSALFVVKKNKSILDNLQQWLTKDEEVLDLPMLLIDDEADNASVNTNSEEKNPTAINNAINKILRSFKQATYLGITATPYANIFIDPSLSEDGATKDLFPKDFLTVLPIPDNYIGADAIFGCGNEENWHLRENARYGKAIFQILNEEQKDFFVFKHKKELAETLEDLPQSLYEAVIYFVLATAISDFRYDNNEHRSMMVNVSRFTDVQNVTADLIDNFMEQLKSDIENYSQLKKSKAMQIPSIQKLKYVWDKYGVESIAGIGWSDILSGYLFKAVRRIEVRSVNQKNGSASLNYYAYRGIGMRVIAVGGNSLSRGLTLEGLCVSYFYRNTMMYDTLLQMGRWFGYRNNYENLFKIWMGEDAVDWYGYITDASNELKDELKIMARQKQTPEEFGLKVRQDPGFLIVTARNKMRSGTPVSVPITISGRMIETSRLKSNVDSIVNNNNLCLDFIRAIDRLDGVSSELDGNVNAYIWRNVPKKILQEFVRNFECHPWNLNFQSTALAQFIEKEETLNFWDIAIPYGAAEKYFLVVGGRIIDVYPEERSFSLDNNMRMIRVSGTHVRVGAGGCSKIGLSKTKITKFRNRAKAQKEKITDKTYLSCERKPIALLHLLKNSQDLLAEYPKHIFAIGLGFPGNGKEKIANYIVNSTELKNWIDISDIEDEDDDYDV
ncbi:Z1 domain-containing protein [uncultured Anaeromusa sp.]|uniref:Z1 domain-containing protein n=1 Tax=uncultured Anaeromusa sp. TaxID=673273 RepID=UPI0029C8F813|nr:Z1 domain-containing protein [uncultured Anaeromusa sp.]